MKTAFAYARFSSDNQREESIEAQFYEINKFAQEEGILIEKYFSDEAISGRTVVRPQFQEMLSEIYDGKKVDYIIVHKVDRFSRDKYQSAIIKEKLSRRGVRVLYAAQKLSDTPEGDLMESILEGFAQYYSKNLAQETKKGLYTNARSAKFNGGIVPFGFKLDDDNFYIINEYEAVAVRLMYELYLSGGNMSKIARSINDKGYTTRYNKPFTSDSIRRILTNPKNAGIYQYGLLETSYASTGKRTMKATRNDEDIVTIEDAIPAIVDKDIFERVNEMIKRRANYRRPKQKVDYALKGKIFCSCGKPMVGNTFGPANKKYSYYKCKECGVTVKREPLENYILNVGRKYMLSKSDRLIELIEEEVGKLMDTQDTDRQALKKRLDQIDREESNCINFITQMGANEKIKEKLEELSKEKKEIEASLKIELDPINLTKEVRMWIRKIKNEEDNTSLSKRDIIQLLVDRVVVDKESIKIYFNFCPPNKTTPACAGTLLKFPLIFKVFFLKILEIFALSLKVHILILNLRVLDEELFCRSHILLILFLVYNFLKSFFLFLQNPLDPMFCLSVRLTHLTLIFYL